MTARIEVLYVSSAAAPDEFDRIETKVTPNVQSVSYGMPQAAFKFHNLIQQGLLADEGVTVLSVVGRPVSPKFHAGGWWRTTKTVLGSRHSVVHPGFPNVTGAKQLVLSLRLAVLAMLWRVRTSRCQNRVVIVDGAYVTGLPGVLLALRGARVSRVGIFSDIYSYMEDVDDAATRGGTLSHKALRRVHTWNVAQLDAFVFLTEAMADLLLPGKGRPYVVIEGLADASIENDTGTPVVRTATPVVMYAGALRREYGVADLVEACKSLDVPDLKLVIYGAGDYAEDLSAEASRDSRIEFRGAAPLSEVWRAERESWLLVNPRPIDQDFTRLSFPSKNMEYLSSGTATLSTRLPGMPAEYYDYLFTVDGVGARALAGAIRDALKAGLPALEKKGALGRQFVLERKNNRLQASRILRMAGIAPSGEEPHARS